MSAIVVNHDLSCAQSIYEDRLAKEVAYNLYYIYDLLSIYSLAAKMYLWHRKNIWLIAKGDNGGNEGDTCRLAN